MTELILVLFQFSLITILFFFLLFFIFFEGVLLYEMLMASTPFAPKKADNVTELFTNIAMVTVRLIIIVFIHLMIFDTYFNYCFYSLNCFH